MRTGGNSLTSSYVNLDREPLFYKNTKQVVAALSSKTSSLSPWTSTKKQSQNDDDHLRMSWVANELVCDGERFYMECVREPPEWFLWWEKYIWSIFVWYVAGCGAVKRRSTSIKLGSEYSVFATKILSESKKGSNDRKAKFLKCFIFVGSGLGAGRLFHSVWAGSVVFNSWHFGLFCLGHLYCNAFSTFDFSGIVSFETWPLLTLYPWMLLIKFIKFI